MKSKSFVSDGFAVQEAKSSVSWLFRSAKKVLSNLFYCGQHRVNQAVFNLLLVNVAGVRLKLRSFTRCPLWFVT